MSTFITEDKALNLNQPDVTADFQRLGESVRESYRNAAAKYRSDDEIEITTEHHRRLQGILGALSSSFGRPITALDLGCGTGRYFHCLKNVRHLTGVDISDEMLRIADKPVCHEQITVEKIQLRCENVHFTAFPPESFDFIYSLGMFGNGCPVTATICNHFYDWLKPGGKLFFNVIGLATMPFTRRVRHNLRARIYPFLPAQLKNRLDARSNGIPFFGLKKKELAGIMRASRFHDFSVAAHQCQSQLWRGVHVECSASKPLDVRDVPQYWKT